MIPRDPIESDAEMDDSRFQTLLRSAAGLDSPGEASAPSEEGECLSFFRWEEHFAQEADLTPDEQDHVRRCPRCQMVRRVFLGRFERSDMEPKPTVVFRTLGVGLAAAASIAVAVTVAYLLWPAQPIAMDAWIETVLGETSRSASVSADGLPVLHSGDRFRVAVHLSRTAYVYLLVYDSTRRLHRIHPTQENMRKAESYPPGRRLVPAPPASYTLDENRGAESIIVLAAERRVTDVERLLGELRATASRTEERSRALDQMRDVLSRFGDAVRIITFKHE